MLKECLNVHSMLNECLNVGSILKECLNVESMLKESHCWIKVKIMSQFWINV